MPGKKWLRACDMISGMRSANSCITKAGIFGFFLFSAFGQEPIPCKYFPVPGKASIAQGGGLFNIEIRSAKTTSQPNGPVEYSKQCEIAIETTVPWLTLVNRTQPDSRGYATLTLMAQANSESVSRTASIVVGNSHSLSTGIYSHPVNAFVSV